MQIVTDLRKLCHLKKPPHAVLSSAPHTLLISRENTYAKIIHHRKSHTMHQTSEGASFVRSMCSDPYTAIFAEREEVTYARETAR